MNKKPYIIILLSIITCSILILIIYSIGKTYLKLAPKLNSFFEIGYRLENEQKLEDSTFLIYNLGDKKPKLLDLREPTSFYFINLSSVNFELLQHKTNIEKKIEEHVYLMVVDTLRLPQDVSNLKTIKANVYFCDSVNYPFKVKEIIPSYILQTNNYIIKQSTLGDLNSLK